MVTPTAHDLTVMTFNVHHGAGTDGLLSLQRIADVITSTGADLIGLQEVDRHYSDRSDWADQAAELAALTGMQMVFGANLDSDPPAGRTDRSQYGTAILSRYPIMSSDNTRLSRTGDGEQRGLLRATVEINHRTVSFYNTHLAVESADDRRRQVAEILELLDTDGHTVLVGDLNAQQNAPEIRTLADSLTDTWAATNEGNGFSFPSDEPTERIDYILTGRNAAPMLTDVVDIRPEASDHRPVISRISLA